MKRVGLFLATISMVFLLTACGGKEKKLDCNLSMEENGVTVNQNFLWSFEGNGKFKSAILTQEAIVSEDVLKIQSLDEYKKNFETIIKSQYKNIDKLDYTIATEGDNKVVVKLNFKDIDSVATLTGKTNAKASKKDFENIKKLYDNNSTGYKYTCTVK
ncbi:MAG: hypothetical protein HFI49_00195 [Bacilli bacterium]|jgi:hypothetical protein|nr:hypothetical protein [Bacilli bacterium]